MNAKTTATTLLRASGIHAEVTSALIDRKTRLYDIEIEISNGLTFDGLDKIAELFATKRINVGARYKEGCPTCGGETSVILEILGATVTLPDGG